MIFMKLFSITQIVRYLKTTSKVINMVSYNYLGFGGNEGSNIGKVEKTISEYGTGVCTTVHEMGKYSE